MFKYLWVYAFLGFLAIMIFLTCAAIADVMKNDMEEGDTIFDFIEDFSCEYTGLYFMWIVLIVIVSLVSFICWLDGMYGG